VQRAHDDIGPDRARGQRRHQGEAEPGRDEALLGGPLTGLEVDPRPEAGPLTGVGQGPVTPPGRVDAATARQYADIGVHRLVIQPVTEDGSDIEDLIESAGQTLVGRI
jgi:hypothetical protein